MPQAFDTRPDRTSDADNASAEEALRIVQISDCHLYADPAGCLVGVNTQETCDQILQMAKQQLWPVDLLLATGDLVHDASPAGYRRLRTRFQALEVPVHCLPGNHDLPEVMNQHLQADRVRMDRVFQHAGWLVILLDSTIPGEERGRLSSAELSLLEQTLASHPQQHVLITFHHHATPVGSRWMDRMALDNPDDLFRVVDHHRNVRGILWGHIHQAFEGRHGEVRLMGSPSTCIQFTPRQDRFGIDPRAPGLRWLKLLTDGTILSGIQRLDSTPLALDLGSPGY
ncbi:MAG TPA: 3',5'-cyclic-AMP phosphodiesterase [Sedimenticola sp.]|nr:3',5'-cyclic-AMP phosphodiesterase [Sedimenticola sp.]